MEAVKTILSPKFDFPVKMRELAFHSENRAEFARIEALGLLKSFFPFHDFNPEDLVSRKGRILKFPAGLPINN